MSIYSTYSTLFLSYYYLTLSLDFSVFFKFLGQFLHSIFHPSLSPVCLAVYLLPSILYSNVSRFPPPFHTAYNFFYLLLAASDYSNISEHNISQQRIPFSVSNMHIFYQHFCTTYSFLYFFLMVRIKNNYYCYNYYNCC